jgi:hypothetical protein
MHYRSCRVHISPAVQNLSEWPRHVLTEVVTVELFARAESVDQNGPLTLKNTVSIVVGAAIVGLALVGTSSADTHHILS